MKAALSQQQSKIVHAADGPYLVVAAAGSGKTRILTERVRYLLEERKIRTRILALTFTNKAAHEMRERLEDLPELSDRTFIGTIHSFCQSVIESYGTAVGYAQTPTILERESDRIAILEEVFLENAALRPHVLRHETQADRRKYLYSVFSKISGWKRQIDEYQSLLNGEWPDATQAMVFRDYNDRLANQGAIDYDDILLLAFRILSGRPKITQIYERTYSHICVDEAQDLNSVQYAIISLLAATNKNLLMVGDPHQAIYGFNGSSADYMEKRFVADFGADVLHLRENFRSARSVIRAANALYPDSINQANTVLQGRLELVKCANEDTEASWVSGKIAEWLKIEQDPQIDGKIKPERIAVLARTRAVFGPLEKALTSRRIPFHLRQPAGGNALESDLGRIFDFGLRLIVNPRNDLHRREFEKLAKLTEPIAIDPNNPLLALSQTPRMAPEELKQWLEAAVTAWRLLSQNVSSFSQAMDGLESALAGPNRSAGSSEPEEEVVTAIADITFLRQVWGNYAKMVARDSRSLSHFRNQMSMGTVTPHAVGDGVTLATVHAVKGLEYDIVFLIGMVDGTFPDYRAVKAGPDAIMEERNDAFVAITRSKRYLYLTSPEAKFMPWDKDTPRRQTQSRFLTPIIKAFEQDTEVLFVPATE